MGGGRRGPHAGLVRAPLGGYAEVVWPRNARVPVEVHDPQLSDDANRALTEEVREAVEADEVELPVDRPREVGHDHPAGATFFSTLWSLRIVVGLTAALFVVFGAIIGITEAEWWVLPVSLVVEKPANSTLAMLEEEGVQDAERLFNDHVQEFAGGGRGSRTKKVLSAGDNERTVRPWQNERQAALEQQTAMTPSSEASGLAPARRARGGRSPRPSRRGSRSRSTRRCSCSRCSSRSSPGAAGCGSCRP